MGKQTFHNVASSLPGATRALQFAANQRRIEEVLRRIYVYILSIVIRRKSETRRVGRDVQADRVYHRQTRHVSARILISFSYCKYYPVTTIGGWHRGRRYNAGWLARFGGRHVTLMSARYSEKQTYRRLVAGALMSVDGGMRTGTNVRRGVNLSRCTRLT